MMAIVVVFVIVVIMIIFVFGPALGSFYCKIFGLTNKKKNYKKRIEENEKH